MDNLAFMQRIPDETFKLIVTSPPYNLGKDYESRSPLDLYIAAQEKVIAECVRLLRPDGSICWQVGNYVSKGEIVPMDTILYPIFRAHDLKLRNRIVWTFGHGLHCSKRLSGRYETINWWTRGDSYTWNLDPIRVPSKYPNKRYFKGPNIGKLSGNPKGKNPSDVWTFPNVKNNHPEKTIHPCQFPVELVERVDPCLVGAETWAHNPYSLPISRPTISITNVPDYTRLSVSAFALETVWPNQMPLSCQVWGGLSPFWRFLCLGRSPGRCSAVFNLLHVCNHDPVNKRLHEGNDYESHYQISLDRFGGHFLPQRACAESRSYSRFHRHRNQGDAGRQPN